MRGVRPLCPHIDQSLDGGAVGRVTFGQTLFFNRSNSQRWLSAEGHLLAWGVGPSFLKGDLGCGRITVSTTISITLGT